MRSYTVTQIRRAIKDILDELGRTGDGAIVYKNNVPVALLYPFPSANALSLTLSQLSREYGEEEVGQALRRLSGGQ